MKFFSTGAATGIAMAVLLPWAAGPGSAATPSWTYDSSAMDRTVRPGDNFSEYANGSWLKRAQIPPDKGSLSPLSELQDRVNLQVRAILEEAAAARAPKGSIRQKVGDFYASALDAAEVEAAGLAPLQGDFREIDALADSRDLSRHFGRIQWNNIPAPVSLGFPVDARDPNMHIVQLGQGGLGMPDRDFYLDEANPRFAGVRRKYQQHLINMFRLAGFSDAEGRAKRVYALETKIAASHRALADLRQADKNYHPSSLADLRVRGPGMDWPAFFSGAGLAAAPRLVLGQPEAIAGAAALVSSEPLEAWKDYLRFRTLSRYAPVLPRAIVDENFEFTGKTLAGAQQIPERWVRALNQTNLALGEGVGQIYVARHFPPQAKVKVERLVRDLRAAMDARLRRVGWMSPATRAKARVKLAALDAKVGYPDRWRDYSALEIRRGDAFGNFRRGLRFNHQRMLDRLKGPVDRDEWPIAPQTVNAAALLTRNQIVLTAASLLPPFFDPRADDAVNYGAVGIGIGHEISHHFDDQGRKHDAQGRLADWWDPADVARFKALSSRLATQFSGYEPLPGLRVNGEQTLGENLADLAGLAIAHDAYKLSLRGKAAPVIGGLSGDQRFFISFAQVWRAKYRDEALSQALKTGTHTPVHLRPSTVRNFDAWYDAFNVKDGALYLPPEQRVRIW